MTEVTYRAHPSLALIKYWGKCAGGVNIPATSSVAVSIDACHTTCRVRALDATQGGGGGARESGDTLTADGAAVPAEIYQKNYRPYLEHIRARLRTANRYDIDISNNFPMASGLASSSSIFATMSLAITKLEKPSTPERDISTLARYGSASAARAVHGGFVELRRGAAHARQLLPARHWPELRMLVAVTASGQKPISSRQAMLVSRTSAFAYRQWIRKSRRVYRDAVRAIYRRDLEHLGTCMQQSYLGMIAVMLSSTPPILYWNDATVALITLCRELRAQGTPAWETTDAGPQVKILTTKTGLPEIEKAIAASGIQCRLIPSTVGGAPEHL